jgi:hypothetical protein
MTTQDLKHALVSLLLGIAITAATSLIQGLLHLCLQWLNGLSGGATAAVAYLTQTYRG